MSSGSDFAISVTDRVAERRDTAAPIFHFDSGSATVGERLGYSGATR